MTNFSPAEKRAVNYCGTKEKQTLRLVVIYGSGTTAFRSLPEIPKDHAWVIKGYAAQWEPRGFSDQIGQTCFGNVPIIWGTNGKSMATGQQRQMPGHNRI